MDPDRAAAARDGCNASDVVEMSVGQQNAAEGQIQRLEQGQKPLSPGTGVDDRRVSGVGGDQVAYLSVEVAGNGLDVHGRTSCGCGMKI